MTAKRRTGRPRKDPAKRKAVVSLSLSRELWTEVALHAAELSQAEGKLVSRSEATERLLRWALYLHRQKSQEWTDENAGRALFGLAPR